MSRWCFGGATGLGWGGGLHYGYGYRLQAIGHANPRSGRTARQETGLDVWSLVACGG